MLNLNKTQKNILKKLIDSERIKISDLASQEGKSVATMYNYRAIFENLKIHYDRGYISLQLTAENYPSFIITKLNHNRVLKEKAIEYALAHFSPKLGDFVFIDGGTTQYLVFEKILEQGGNNLYIITNNPLIVHESLINSSITEKNNIFVLGGKLDRLRVSLYGYRSSSLLGLREYKDLKIDVCFLGIVGILKNGQLMIGTDEEVPQKKQLIRNSKRIVIIIDESKVNRNSWSSIGNIKTIRQSGKEIYIIVGYRDGCEKSLCQELHAMQDEFGKDIIRRVSVSDAGL